MKKTFSLPFFFFTEQSFLITEIIDNNYCIAHQSNDTKRNNDQTSTNHALNLQYFFCKQAYHSFLIPEHHYKQQRC